MWREAMRVSSKFIRAVYRVRRRELLQRPLHDVERRIDRLRIDVERRQHHQHVPRSRQQKTVPAASLDDAGDVRLVAAFHADGQPLMRRMAGRLNLISARRAWKRSLIALTCSSIRSRLRMIQRTLAMATSTEC